MERDFPTTSPATVGEHKPTFSETVPKRERERDLFVRIQRGKKGGGAKPREKGLTFLLRKII